MIKLIPILEQIVVEVGDLANISPYPVKNNMFITDEGWKVRIEFHKETSLSMKDMNINPKIYPPPVYSVSYYIEENVSQHTKSDYKSLFKILKTVVDVCEDFIRKKKPNGLVMFAIHRDDSKMFYTDPAKTKIYRSIAVNSIKKNIPEYTIVDVAPIETFPGIMLYNKEKIKQI
jgi:hypothetical protein